MYTAHKRIFTLLVILCISTVSYGAAQKEKRGFLKFKSKRERQIEKANKVPASSTDGQVTNHDTKEALYKAFVKMPGSWPMSTNEMGYFSTKTKAMNSQARIHHPNVYSTYYNITVIPSIHSRLGAIRLKPMMLAENEQRAVGELGNFSSYIMAKNFMATIDILQQGGGSDFNDLLVRDASVYKINNGNGYGASSIRVRGFDQSLTQVVFNGISLNNPETGAMNTGMYLGMPDWARKTELTKGLGNSINSELNPAGTVNVLSFMPKRNASAEGLASYGTAGQLKTAITLHSGSLGHDEFGASLKIDRVGGNGVPDQTDFTSYGGFLTIYAKPFMRHNFIINNAYKTWSAKQNLLGFNATETSLYGDSYNKTWGELDDETINLDLSTGSSNLTTLTHTFSINRVSKWTNNLYAHIENKSTTGASNANLLKRDRASSGLIDFAGVSAENQSLGTSSKTAGNAILNNNEQMKRFGIQSQYMREVNRQNDFRFGIDYENYTNRHYGSLNNLLGANQYYDQASGLTLGDTTTSGDVFKMADGKHMDHDYRAMINKIGASIKYEGNAGLWNYYIGAAAYYKNLQRKDYFAENEKSSVSQAGWRVNGGFDYKISRTSKVKALTNLSGTPERFDIIFPMHSATENTLGGNRNTYSAEVAYEFRYKMIRVEARAYNTYLSNFSSIQKYGLEDDDAYVLINNLNQNHSGIELNAQLQYGHHRLLISGSYGIWKYTNNGTANAYDINNELTNSFDLYTEGLKIGNATPANIKLRNEFNLFKAFELSVSYSRTFTNYTSFSAYDLNTENLRQDKLDNYGILSLGFNSYKKLRRLGSSIQVFAEVNNILGDKTFNYIYTDSSNPDIPDGTIVTTAQNNLGLNFNVGISYIF